MRARQDRAAHRAGVVIELHLDEGGAHPRHLAGALLRARAEAGRPQRQPAEQAQADEAERHREVDASAHAEKRRAGQRADAAGRLQHDRDVGGLALLKPCSTTSTNASTTTPKMIAPIAISSAPMSLMAPASRRADRSASARMPPAA